MEFQLFLPQMRLTPDQLVERAKAAEELAAEHEDAREDRSVLARAERVTGTPAPPGTDSSPRAPGIPPADQDRSPGQEGRS